MKYLVSFDVIGIQDYIFSSNKLKENIGSSILVQKVFDTFLKESIEKESDNYRTDWKNYDSFQIIDDDSIDSEIVYIGGGNALVAFKNKEIANKTVRNLSKKILEKTSGRLKFLVSYKETDFSDYQEDIKELQIDLMKKKYNKIHTFPMGGIAITREGVTDGLPATKKDNDSYISNTASLKIEESKNNYFKYLISSEEYFPLEFDDLGQKEGNSHIAIVHIDGNNMGDKINNIIKNSINYSSSISIMRKFSIYIDKTFKDTMKETIDYLKLKCIDIRKDRELSKQFNFEENQIPIRPIVINGDDITFVCDGRLGVLLAEYFLKELSKNIFPEELGEGNITACAGITIVKSHFPFYKAYQLSEELCSSAKLKGKALNSENMGSWLDFHIVYSGVTGTLSDIRKENYNVSSMKPASTIKNEKYDFDNAKYYFERFNLLNRPYKLDLSIDEEDSFDRLKELINSLRKIPRSKVKELRSSLLKSQSSVNLLVKELESRNHQIYKYYKANSSFIFKDSENVTPYLDAIELMEFYDNTLELK